MNDGIHKLFTALAKAFGEPHWWPADTPFEVMVGAILTQNTNWINVEKALRNFEDNLLPERIEAMSLEDLKELIRPAGFFNQKAVYLKDMTRWFAGYDFSVENVQKAPMKRIRQELRGLRGIGNETADSIILYAFGFRASLWMPIR